MGRRTLLHFVLASTLLLRGLIAPGYMPEGDGSVGMRLCPAGLGASLASALSAGHSAHQHQAQQSDELTSQDLCPLGDGLGSAALGQVAHDAVFSPKADRPLDYERIDPRGAIPVFFRARAPPVVSN